MQKKTAAILINNLAPGGAERVTTNLTKHLIKLNYNILLITVDQPQKDLYTVDPCIKRIWIEESLKRIKTFKEIRRIIFLRKQLKKEKPDFIIGMMSKPSIMAIISAAGLPVATIVSERNFPGRKKLSIRWGILRKLLYRFADAHIAQTYKGKIWIEKNTGAKNIHVIPNAVHWPPDTFEPIIHPDRIIPKSRKLLLAVGSKTHQKGLDILLEAFQKISQRHPEWDLVILGYKPKEKKNKHRIKIEEIILNLQSENRIHLPGPVGNIGEWYLRAEIFILSSRYEGFPNALLEAMTAGCACIATDCETGPRDIIDHKINGLLIKQESYSDLAKNIEKLIKSEELRKQLSHNAKQKTKKKFNPKIIYSMWENAINSALKNKHQKT
ncbi:MULTISPECIES: glycosyltransferase family 4 protein [Ectothiorhodospira]|uniref:glycosyltransferase family 4 protein n=1 Tax=Ectothiorhodospira TaxID=1051 RepID=UPI001EE969D1|nr:MULTISPECIES: glycosyltransferase family 4 protein [Ectothiorhodospira]MCG5502173.1 glycosyltransferase family 4 protein [Ectothiorhodospira lacustris]MCG5513380.1 glycosyltransferase family 4 protein [Ectothiorhodospira shaposhnikovii]